MPVTVSAKRRLTVSALRSPRAVCLLAGTPTSQSAVELAATFHHGLNQPCELHLRTTAYRGLANQTQGEDRSYRVGPGFKSP
jgi:hypothetical protein